MIPLNDEVLALSILDNVATAYVQNYSFDGSNFWLAAPVLVWLCDEIISFGVNLAFGPSFHYRRPHINIPRPRRPRNSKG